MAGAASFNHVHDWTMHNSPAGTAGWFGWANAVITELIPTAALIIIARRRRSGGHTTYPTVLLVIAVGLSLTAQLAVALPTVFGWMVSALPAIAFFALSKLVFTATKSVPTSPAAPAPVEPALTQALHQLATRVQTLETRPTPGPALTPATPPAAPSFEVTAAGQGRPAATTTKATTPRKRTPAKKTSPAKTTRPRATGTAVAEETALPLHVDTEPSTVTTNRLLPEARIIAQAHQQAHGQPITAATLAQRLQVAPSIAQGVLDALSTIPTAPNDAPHNGTLNQVPA